MSNDYDYINLVINNNFKNISIELDNYKKVILNNINKFILLNNNLKNQTNILEKKEINGKICYLDFENNHIYNNNAIIIGEISKENFNNYTFYI